MDVHYTAAPEGDAIGWCLFEEDEAGSLNIDKFTGIAMPERLRRGATIARFTGKPGQVAEFIAADDESADRLLLVGVGKQADADACAWRNAGARAVRQGLTSGARHLCLIGASDAKAAASLALGARLGAYRFDRYRARPCDERKSTVERLSIVCADTASAEAEDVVAAALAEGVCLARDLVTEPPNILHPEEFAARIEALDSTGLAIDVFDDQALEELGMEAMLAVGRGSKYGSRLCVLSWRGDPECPEPPLVLVGKGVTFDSGGISIKPSAKMEAMKGDMGGAAAVVGAMVTLAKRRACANVVGLVGLVENMPDGNAFRPADILKSAAGKTIEIISTDAEGRLVLCDVLHYAQQRFKPRTVIDLATLTGAIVVALGNERAGLFANDDKLADEISAAGKATGEPVWRLPLDAAYDKMIDSQFADIKNSTSGGGGSITAAQFLKRFIGDEIAWAHLDIAGTAWKENGENPIIPSWATGFGVQLLDRFVADQWEMK